MNQEAEIILKWENGRMMTSVKATDEETLLNTLCTGFVIAFGEMMKDNELTDEEKKGLSEQLGKLISEALYDRMTGKFTGPTEVSLKGEAAQMLKEKMMKGDV